MTAEPQVRVTYFSDVLCVWAYVSQVRLDELKLHFGERLTLRLRFIPVFGDTEERIGSGWSDRGGFAGYARHVREICEEFPHIALHRDVWTRVAPRTSGTAHLFLESVALAEVAGDLPPGADGTSRAEETAWRVRQAFFRDARDVARLDVLLELADELGLPRDALVRRIEDGRAAAAMFRDVELRDRYRIEGSPTYVLNRGRQKLYGNLGYKILEANVQEALQRPTDRASWC